MLHMTNDALLAALGSVGKHYADATEQLKTRHKRLEDIRLELARPFEHEIGRAHV